MSETRCQSTLLLVDDEEHILNALRRVLRDEPYKLLMASGGAAALALLAEREVVLARNLQAESGMLLLNAGKQLSRTLIDKLIAFEASEGARYLVQVRRPEADTSPAKE